MKKMNKIPAIIAAVMMLLYLILDLIDSFDWYIPYLIEEREWVALIVYNFLFLVCGIIFSVGLFIGKKGLPGALMVCGPWIFYYLLCIVLSLAKGNTPYFADAVYPLVFAALLLVMLDKVELPKPVGMLLTVVPAAFILLISLVLDVRDLIEWGTDSFRSFLDYSFGVLLGILFDGSVILAGIAASTEPKKAAPLPACGQAPYQPMPQYQQPVYAQPQQAPQYQQPVYGQPQYQAPVYPQPAPQEQPAAPQAEQ